MQSDVERTLRNLVVIGALSHNDKLMTNDDVFDIYIPTTMRALLRTWYRENRGHNVARIRSTVSSAIEFSKRALMEIRANFSIKLEKVEKISLKAFIFQSFKPSKDEVDNRRAW